MSTKVEKQNEDLQNELDKSSETIEKLNEELNDRPTVAEFEQLQQENSELKTKVESAETNLEEQVADIKALAEVGKQALQYAREYTLGAYVSFAQVEEDSVEYADYQAELREDDDFIGLMRTAAGYYRRSRANRARGRQSSSDYPPPPNPQEKPRFVKSALRPVSH